MCSFRLCPPNQKVFPTPLSVSAGIEELESQHHLDGSLDLHYNIITYVCITIINKLQSPRVLAVNPKAVVSPVTQTLQSPLSLVDGYI